MKSIYRWYRVMGLGLAGGSLLAFQGCGLSDQQLASIWQSIIQTGLNTLVSNILGAFFDALQAAAA